MTQHLQNHLALAAAIALLGVALGGPALAQSADSGQTPNTKHFGAQVIVAPKGIYATINNKPMLDIIHELRFADEDRKTALVKQIQSDPSHYVPPVLIDMAGVEYARGNLDSAIFWFHAGYLRARTDSFICTDPTVRSIPATYANMVSGDLVLKSFSSDPKIAQIVARVVEWDAKTPYNYDRRWIALSGMQSYQAALDPKTAPTSILVPEDQWQDIMQKNRSFYAKMVAATAEQLKKSEGH